MQGTRIGTGPVYFQDIASFHSVTPTSKSLQGVLVLSPAEPPTLHATLVKVPLPMQQPNTPSVEVSWSRRLFPCRGMHQPISSCFNDAVLQATRQDPRTTALYQCHCSQLFRFPVCFNQVQMPRSILQLEKLDFLKYWYKEIKESLKVGYSMA